jgi:glycosyltransferase involved in cell wall biosynthesis
MNNILFVSGLGGDTRRYRCLHHQEQLALQGIASDLREANDMQLYVDATTHDLFMLHRVGYSPLIADLIEIAHLRGKPVIFETDDLIFEPELYNQIAFIDTLSPDAAQRFRQDLYAQAETFAQSDAILTTTQYLAAAAMQHGKPAYIHRNACSTEMVRNAEAAAVIHRKPQPHTSEARATVVIGYFSGTGSHNRDFAVITPALIEILRRYPQAWLHVSGHLALDARFQPYAARIRRAPYVAWQALPNLVASVDINLAPLELDNPFCQAKSEIKYSEAALVGVPTVASPTEAFAYAIQHGENGLLAATEEEWVAALAYLVENPTARQQLGEAARQRVYQNYTVQPRSLELINTLEQIRDNFSPPVADAEKVAQAVAVAMKRHLDELVVVQRQQSTQMEQLRQTIAQWQSQPAEPGRNFWRQSFEDAERRQVEALQDLLARLAGE